MLPRSGGHRLRTISGAVNPRSFRNATAMIDQGMAFTRLAPNMAVKIPAVAAGLVAIEELTARGVVINATVSYSVPQAIAVAEAVERGLARLQEGVDRGLDFGNAGLAPGAVGGANSKLDQSMTSWVVGESTRSVLSSCCSRPRFHTETL